MDEYMTIAGIIQFDPRNRTARNLPVRDIAVRAIGNNKMVNITVWPENEHIPLAKGDFIVADGKFTQSLNQNKNGEQQTYYNLSAKTLFRFAADTTSASPTTAAAKETAPAPTSVDDFPF
jgi:hypothetical protein